MQGTRTRERSRVVRALAVGVRALCGLAAAVLGFTVLESLLWEFGLDPEGRIGMHIYLSFPFGSPVALYHSSATVAASAAAYVFVSFARGKLTGTAARVLGRDAGVMLAALLGLWLLFLLISAYVIDNLYHDKPTVEGLMGLLLFSCEGAVFGCLLGVALSGRTKRQRDKSERDDDKLRL